MLAAQWYVGLVEVCPPWPFFGGFAAMLQTFKAVLGEILFPLVIHRLAYTYSSTKLGHHGFLTLQTLQDNFHFGLGGPALMFVRCFDVAHPSQAS